MERKESERKPDRGGRRRKAARKNTRCLLEWQLEGLMIPPWPRRLVPVRRPLARGRRLSSSDLALQAIVAIGRVDSVSEPGYRFINQRSFRFTPQSTFRGDPWPVAGDRCPRSLKQAFAAPIRRERNGARDLIFRVHSERRILEYFWFWTEKNVPVIRAFVYVTRS